MLHELVSDSSPRGSCTLLKIPRAQIDQLPERSPWAAGEPRAGHGRCSAWSSGHGSGYQLSVISSWCSPPASCTKVGHAQLAERQPRISFASPERSSSLAFRLSHARTATRPALMIRAASRGRGSAPSRPCRPSVGRTLFCAWRPALGPSSSAQRPLLRLGDPRTRSPAGQGRLPYSSPFRQVSRPRGTRRCRRQALDGRNEGRLVPSGSDWRRARPADLRRRLDRARAGAPVGTRARAPSRSAELVE